MDVLQPEGVRGIDELVRRHEVHWQRVGVAVERVRRAGRDIGPWVLVDAERQLRARLPRGHLVDDVADDHLAESGPGRPGAAGQGEQTLERPASISKSYSARVVAGYSVDSQHTVEVTPAVGSRQFPVGIEHGALGVPRCQLGRVLPQVVQGAVGRVVPGGQCDGRDSVLLVRSTG